VSIQRGGGKQPFSTSQGERLGEKGEGGKDCNHGKGGEPTAILKRKRDSEQGGGEGPLERGGGGERKYKGGGLGEKELLNPEGEKTAGGRDPVCVEKSS